MSDNTNNEEEEYEAGVEDVEDIMYSHYPSIRILNLSPSNFSIAGIILSETDDSFLVGTPARFLKEQNSEVIEAKEYISYPYFRLMKSGVTSVIPMHGVFEIPYNIYLANEALEKYPEFMESLPSGILEIEEYEYPSDIPVSEELETKLMEAVSTGSVMTTNRSVH